MSTCDVIIWPCSDFMLLSDPKLRPFTEAYASDTVPHAFTLADGTYSSGSSYVQVEYYSATYS